MTGETAESETGPRLKLPLKVSYTAPPVNIGLASWDTMGFVGDTSNVVLYFIYLFVEPCILISAAGAMGSVQVEDL